LAENKTRPKTASQAFSIPGFRSSLERKNSEMEKNSIILEWFITIVIATELAGWVANKNLIN
jgi:hypothetical protein